MSPPRERLRNDALTIWKSAVAAVRPEPLLRAVLTDPAAGIGSLLERAPRILVLGAGKAGAAMASAVEDVLHDRLDRLDGWVNVPAGTERPLARVHLHPARPAGSNHPTADGVRGSRRILDLAEAAGPEDVALCLVSGGGSALLPAPADGTTLEDKQEVTRLLHGCGATIDEMNAVRKHLSAIKGGRLAQAFRGRRLFSLILSDVIGDPLDVIASGPTAADPTTFAEVMAILERYGLTGRVPAAVLDHLRKGRDGVVEETAKTVPPRVENRILGNNRTALDAARRRAEELGYTVVDLGSFLEGETRQVGIVLAGVIRSLRRDRVPVGPPVCLLSGGETTVTLGASPGKGGRNQELALATCLKLGRAGMLGVVVLSGGTDGEDGPTDAAGAMADEETLVRAASLGLNAEDHLFRHDAYPFFDKVGGLIRTGPTDTNVMDVRVMLVGV